MSKVTNCNGCIACCIHMQKPPFVISYHGDPENFEPGEFSPMDFSAEAIEEFARFRSAPEEARRLYWERMNMRVNPEAAPVPCNWLDFDNLRCRFYSHRPGVCRRLEVGGDRCLAHRKNVGVA